MIETQRKRLEDAIIQYGAAKALHAGTETPYVREMARKAVTVAWELVSQTIDDIAKRHEEELEDGAAGEDW